MNKELNDINMDDPKVIAARKKLEQRCEKSGIELTETGGLDEDDIWLKVSLPSGREKRLRFLICFEDIKELLAIPFEDFTFLSEYNAICSYKYGKIEALIESIPGFAMTSLKKPIFGHHSDYNVGTEGKDELVLEPKKGSVGPEIIIGPISAALKALIHPPEKLRLSLTLKNLQILQHDKALSILQKISNSLFFQIELLLGIPLYLSRMATVVQPISRSKQKHTIENIQYPNMEYDKAPISLYWYARTALKMPLLQFIAFYQVIEFYFSTYYQAEARRKIRSILKNPAFRSDRDADLGRVLTAIRTKGGVFGDERAQLRATINECVDPDDLRDFLSISEKRKTFFSSKTKGLTAQKIPIANPATDLRNEVADRIYDIRCKIVHTKNDSYSSGSNEPILPFSKGAKQLLFDIELIQYLAQQTLISASSLIEL
tara:strand:+ start:33196 stop:34488 length:1293 start_codon:yes stop_codon:yes gene_type:complete